MHITNISPQAKNPDRLNVFVNHRYSFSLNINQALDLKIKVGQNIDKDELDNFKKISEIGKLYTRCYKYCFLRPRSTGEVRLYLKSKNISSEFIEEIIDRLNTSKILDDYKFAKWWVENRHYKKGISIRRLKLELRQKAISNDIIEEILKSSERDDKSELLKVYLRKKNKYNKEKIIHYLVSKGFIYGDIIEVINQVSLDSEGGDDVAKGLIKT